MPVHFRNLLQRHYRLTLPLASLLALLIQNEYVTFKLAYEKCSTCDLRALVYRLRIALREQESDIEINSTRGLGYWLDDAPRRKLARKHGLKLAPAGEIESLTA